MHILGEAFVCTAENAVSQISHALSCWDWQGVSGTRAGHEESIGVIKLNVYASHGSLLEAHRFEKIRHSRGQGCGFWYHQVFAEFKKMKKMKKWMKFAVKYCRFCEIKRLKKNEKMKNAKKDFCKFQTGDLKVPQKNEIWKTDLQKWICIWKVIKLRPNIGLIVGTRMFTGAEVGRTAGDLRPITRSGRFLAPSIEFLSLFWIKYFLPWFINFTIRNNDGLAVIFFAKFCVFFTILKFAKTENCGF
jgi:hypothetical protein